MHRRAAGALVEVIDVLGDDGDLGMVLPCGDGAVPVVGSDGGHQVVAPQIPSPDPFGIVAPALGAGQLVRIEAGPQSVLVVAKCRHPAFRGDPCAAEYRHTHSTKIVFAWRRLSDTGWVELRDWLRVDAKAGKPLFDQLRSQVIDGVRAGALPPGSRLPTVRDLAGQLGVAANTVARAYRELESAAIVETRGRFGTFISRFDPTDAAMAAAAKEYVQVARALGLTKSDAMRYLTNVPDE